MNKDTTSPRRDPKDVVIEFNDDWVTINGVEFGVEPLAGEIFAVLGEPQLVVVAKQSHGEQHRYIWPEYGIVASSPNMDRRMNNCLQRPGNQTRDKRIANIEFSLTGTTNLATIVSNDGQLNIFNAQKNDPTGSWAKEFRNIVSNARLIFTGRARINGTDLNAGMTFGDLKRLDLRLLYSSIESMLFFGRSSFHGTILLAQTYCVDASADRSLIDWIGFTFDRWRNPSSRTISSISLRRAERIINTLDIEDEISEGLERHDFSLATWQRLSNSFGALILTNQRLILHTANLNDGCEWPIESAPEIIIGQQINKPVRFKFGDTARVNVIQITAANAKPIELHIPEVADWVGSHLVDGTLSRLEAFKRRVDSVVAKWAPKSIAQRPRGVADQTHEAFNLASSQTNSGRVRSGSPIYIHFHWLAYLPSVFWLLVAVGSIALLLPQARTSEEPAIFLIALAFAFCIGLSCLWRMLALKCEHLVVAVSEKIVHHMKGVFNTRETNPPRQGITPNIHFSWLGRPFGCGTVILELQNGKTLTLRGMNLTEEAISALRGWR